MKKFYSKIFIFAFTEQYLAYNFCIIFYFYNIRDNMIAADAVSLLGHLLLHWCCSHR